LRFPLATLASEKMGLDVVVPAACYNRMRTAEQELRENRRGARR
jgi:hypothetical protein